MIKKLLALEEQHTLTIFCIAEIVTLVLAYLLVMIFLDGSRADNIVLLMVAYCLLVYLIKDKYPKIAKNMLSCSSALFSAVTIVSNSGHYGAIAPSYFLFLIISIAHYDMFQVVLSSVSVIVTNVLGFFLFPEAYLKIHNTTVWIFILFIYSIAVICSLIITGRTHNLFEKERQLQLSELELTHLEQVENKNKEHSKFIHNMQHYFVAIGSLAVEENYKEILNILSDLNVEITKQQSIFYTTNRVMNAILSEKFFLAENQHIPMDIYVEPNVCLNNISDGDIVIMLGNLLDNALEAVKKSTEENRFIKVRIYHENDGRICVIKIENSFLTPIIYSKKGKILTNKKHGSHGFGLKSIDKTAQKYGGYLQCSYKDNIFTSILLLSDNSSDKNYIN